MVKCALCGFLDSQKNVCLVSGQTKEPDKDYCSTGRKTVHKCAHCGILLLNEILTIDSDDQVHFLCDKCALGLNTCAACKSINTCSFETDPSPLPKLVQKRIQQGPMTQITQIRNPERENITCRKNCPCFSEEFGCMRQFNYCNNIERNI